jgi:LysR family transcriptional activator of dmlA
MKIRDLELWEAFVAVAETGNFSRASARLRIPLPQVSKRIARIEDLLGVKLFQRTTRKVAMTDEGRRALPEVLSLLDESNQMEDRLAERIGQVSGNVRITAAPFVGRALVLPVLKTLNATYERLSFELDLTEKRRDLIEDQFDIAFRIESPHASSLIYKKLVPNHIVAVASPAYLKARGANLRNPKDLRHHDILTLELLQGCKFKQSTLTVREVCKPLAINCQNGEVLKESALNGDGILIRSVWDVLTEIESGQLVLVLHPDVIEPFGNIFAVFPERKFLPERIRVVVDAAELAAKRWQASFEKIAKRSRIKIKT